MRIYHKADEKPIKSAIITQKYSKSGYENNQILKKQNILRSFLKKQLYLVMVEKVKKCYNVKCMCEKEPENG